MSQNLTTTSSSLSSDVETATAVCSKPWDVLIFIIHTISLLVNIFHVAVLSRLESLRGKKYRWILINLSLADMSYVISMGSLYLCYDVNMFTFLAGEPILRIPWRIPILHSTYISYFIFLVASVEQYLAICKPYSYQSSIIVRRLPAVFAVAWLFVSIISTCVAIMNQSSPFWTRNWQFTVLQVMILAVAPNVVSATLLINVGKELNRMKNQSAFVADNGKEKKAAIYVIIVFAMEMAVFLLNMVCIIISHTSTETACEVWNAVVKAPHTIANTVIYGWRTKAYQEHVRKIFGFKSSRIGSAET